MGVLIKAIIIYIYGEELKNVRTQKQHENAGVMLLLLPEIRFIYRLHLPFTANPLGEKKLNFPSF